MTTDIISNNYARNFYLQVRLWAPRLIPTRQLFSCLQLFNELGRLYGLPSLCDAATLSRAATPLSPMDRHELLSFYRRWNRFSESLTVQWQITNYVSAVFVG